MALSKSLIASLGLHAAVLGFALSPSWQDDPAPPAPSKPVAVSVVTPSAISRIKAGQKTAVEEENTGPVASLEKSETKIEASEPERSDRAKAEPPAPKKLAALPPPSQSSPPSPASEAKTDPAPAAAKTIAEQSNAANSVPIPVRANRNPASKSPPREEPQRAPPETQPDRKDRIADLIEKPAPRAEKNSRFDPERISALLNRDPTARPPQQAPQEAPTKPWREPSSLDEQAFDPPKDDSEPRRVARGMSDGNDDRMSANEIDAFRAQVSRCWTPPIGGLGSDRIVVKLHIALHRDGSLAFPPKVANTIGSPFFRPAAESALRALTQCQPYRMPPEKYDQWREMLLTFDPRQMYGG
jgi:hypothetical protein